MRRILIIPVIVSLFCLGNIPVACFAQYMISARVLNNSDYKPIANANVFLNNATIGAKTATDGTFTLRNVTPGKYDLIISSVGFQTYSLPITITNKSVALPDIALQAKVIGLQEVKIKFKSDPARQRNLDLFKAEFLGSSHFANECQILNPDVIDLNYDDEKKILTASSYDFIEIENDALGYKIKYALNDFSLQMNNDEEKKVYYRGPSSFEELKGSPSRERYWKKNRQEAYENSPMHFLRSALNNRLDDEGFKVLRLAFVPNPERPADELINARIKYYEDIRSLNRGQRDSLSYWKKKARLEKTFKKLLPFQLEKQDIIKSAEKPGQYFLSCDNDGLYVAFNKTHHFHISDKLNYLYNNNNTENTLLLFNASQVSFDSNGVISDPYGVMYYGVWGKNRVGDLLPVNYQPAEVKSVGSQATIEGDSITSKLTNFQAIHIAEKTYLHFDKPYYATGDTIFFKAYVTLGEKHQLSDLSGVLHIDLIDPGNKIEQGIKLPLVNGLAWGDFVLPDTLAPGNYRIRAYTRWMLNDGNLFEQNIPVGSVHTKNIPENSTAKALIGKPDLQFFPESGQLIVGLPSKVAFKAVGMNGLGINVKGSVTDNSGRTVCQLESSHLGMGSFSFIPETGKSYKANVMFADGSKSSLDLPTPVNKGISLAVNNDSLPKAGVKILSSTAYYAENKGKDYTLLIYSGGSVTTVPIKLDSSVISLDILKRHLHTGIATITLFSTANEPLCERLIFVQNYDKLNLNLSANKGSYATREKVSIKLNAKTRADSAALGHFSISVIDESKVDVNEDKENTILSNLLFTSDLKGTIEQPNYYFTNISDKKLKELDLVMLTHGYRRFEWKQVLSVNNQSLVYQPEKSLEITGQAKNLLGAALAKANVSLLPTQSKQLLTTTADDKGYFAFRDIVFWDSTRFILQATNAKGKMYTKLTYNSEKPAPVIPVIKQNDENINTIVSTAYLANNEKQQEELSKSGLGKGKILKEVKIKAIKPDDRYETQSLAGAGHADQVLHRKDIGYASTLETALSGRLHGIQFYGGSPFLVGMGMYSGPMLIVVDGTIMPNGSEKDSKGKSSAMQGFNLNSINVSDVETVEVLKYANSSIYGMQGGNGVLVITTRKGAGTKPEDIASTGILPITIQGYQKVREFYSPKYEGGITYNHPDLRSTIYWKPELTTDKDGNASFDFYNADGTGNYRVVVEGIDEKGNLGRQTFPYKVQ